MTVHRIKFEGPRTHAVPVATLLADSDGVELVASEPPVSIGESDVRLELFPHLVVGGSSSEPASHRALAFVDAL